MGVPPIKATKRLTAFVDLTPAELLLLRDMAGPPREAARRAVLHGEGNTQPALYLLHEGWAMSSVTLPGGRRQIIKLHLAGDLMGTPSLPFERSVETIGALTRISFSEIPLERLGALFAAAPRLGVVMFLIAQQERAALTDRLAAVGQLKAEQRVAALLVHLYDRLRSTDPAAGPTIEVPLTQDQIGDILGLTPVHVNRTLRQFARDGLVSYGYRTFELRDLPRLRELATIPQRVVRRDPDWLPDALAG